MRIFKLLVLMLVLVGQSIAVSVTDSRAESKPLRIAIDKAYPPYSLIGPTGKATGLAIEMWRAWSEVTATPVEFIPSGWEETLNALKNGSADVHFGMFKNASRSKWADFAEPIHQIHTSLFFRADDRPVELDKLAGQKVGVWAGTYQYQFLKDNHPDIELVAVKDGEQLILKLLNGEIRAILNEVPSVEADLAAFGIRGVLSRSEESLFSNYVQPAVRKGESELLERINAGFRKIPTSRLHELEKMWMPGTSDHFFTGAGGKIEFTPEEEDWLIANPVVKLAVTTFIQPVDILDDAGNYKGLNADLIDLLNRKLGINVVPEFHDSWGGVVKAVTGGSVDGAFSLSITPEREKSVLFTKPYAFDPVIAVVPRSRNDIVSWTDLAGKTVSVVKGASIVEEISKMVGDGVLTKVESEEDGLKAVISGTADVHVSWLLPYGNTQRASPVEGLKIALTRNSEGGTLRIGIHKDRPELLGIIRKGLNAISREELTRVRNKWLFTNDVSELTSTELTPEEMGWLQGHPIIRLAVLEEYAPFDFTDDDGKHSGLHSDLLRLINKNLGINAVTIPFRTWKEAYEKAASGELEGIMSLSWTKKRENTFLFTTPYHYTPADLVVRDTDKSVRAWTELNGKTIWTQANSSLITKIKNDLPDATILEAENEKAALEKLAAGNGDAYVAWISADKPKLKAMGLKVTAAIDTRQGELLIGVHKSRPLVASIIQKGLNAVSTKEMTALRDTWLFDKRKRVELTDEEKAWIKNHTVKVGIEQWSPVAFMDKSGQPQGLTVRFLQIIKKSTGLKYEFVGDNWSVLLNRLKNKTLDLLPGTYYTDERATYGVYSKPHFRIREFVYVKKANKDIHTIDDIADKRVAIVEGYGTIPKIRAKYPKMSVVETKDLLASINAVINGEVDALFEAQMVVEQTMKANSIIGLRGISQTVFKSSPIHFFSRDDEPLLHSILQKGLDAISMKEKDTEIRKWVTSIESERDKIGLSAVEQDWLSAHEDIRLGIDGAWPPFEFVDEDGKYAGLSSGYVDAVSKRLEIEMKAGNLLKWSEVIEKIKIKELDVLPAVARTPERDSFLNFTKPYIKIPIIIATAKDGAIISELSDLEGKNVGVVKGYAAIELIRAENSSLNFVELPNVASLLEALSDGVVDAAIDNLWVISYEKDRLKLEDVKISAPTPYNYELSMGVRKDWPEFIPILEKAISSLTKQEKAAIKNAWMAVQVQFGLDTKTILLWAIPIGSSGGLIILVIVVWNRKLGSEIAERKRTERELLFTQFAVDYAAEAVFWISPVNGAFEYVNETAYTSLGYSREELLKMYIPEVDIDFPAEKFPDLMQMLAEQRFTTFESRHQRKNGDVFDVEVRAYLAENEGREILIANTMDISERKMAAKALETAHQELGEAMGHIEGSINYASRIQRSVLPEERELAEAFADHLVIWQPKDVVGGDIYLHRKCDNGHLLILIDCTGHGVPGAFMAMIATGAFDQALIEIPDGNPAALLQRANQLVKSVLGQDGSEGESDDGFECGLCLIDEVADEITYTGARFELWSLNNGEFTITKGDKAGIGYRRTEASRSFTNHVIPTDSDTSYYMTSDGLVDQVGGDKHRAFGKRRLKDIILDYSKMKMSVQAMHILRAFEEYQHNEERRDDISLVGFKLKS